MKATVRGAAGGEVTGTANCVRTPQALHAHTHIAAAA